MSFQLLKQPFFGRYTETALPDGREPLLEYVLQNIETGERVSIIPGYGAIVRELVLRRNPVDSASTQADSTLLSLIEAPESPQALFADETYASALLYPFASRIRGGLYTFGGANFALPMNETKRNNALHGLLFDQPFITIAEEATDNMARLTLRYAYAGTTNGYPFPFELTVTYTLTPDGLTLAYSALNTGPTASPCSFGWHPYFTMKPYPHANEPGVVESDTLIDSMTLILPAESVIVLDDDLMPTGVVNPLATNTFTLKNWQVDNPFIVSPSEAGIAETRLQAPAQRATLVIGQETGPGKLNYLIVFTPPKRDSIAIEPQTANVDAFNTSDGLHILAPGKALEGRIQVRLEGMA